MKINLRKANALQHAINEQISKLNIRTTIDFDEFDSNPDLTLRTAQEKMNLAVEKRTTLLDAYFEIRNRVSVANTESGINTLLASLARTVKDIGMFDRLGSELAMNTDVIAAKLEKQRSADARMSGYGCGITSSVLTEQHITDNTLLVKKLKRDKQEIQDKLLESNISTAIKLDNYVVSVLTDHGLI